MRILWLKTGPLHPLDTGGKLRTYHMLRTLRESHELTYLALWPRELPAEQQAPGAEYSHRQQWIPWDAPARGRAAYFADLAANAFSRLPYVLGKYRSEGMAAAITAADRGGEYDLIVCDFLTPAVNVFPGYPNRRELSTPALLFQHNVESQVWERLAANTAHPITRRYFTSQWRRLRDFERRVAGWFNGVVTVSDADSATLAREFGLRNILGSVPTGVDCDYFASAAGERSPGSVCFLGSMDWMPNIDAVEWFMDDIWPLLKRQLPNLRFTIIGRSPTAAIRNLASRHPDVEVTGSVPDVRPHLAGSAAMLVPLRAGGGTRIKIYEAMAAGVPVVSTTIGAEGLGVRNGLDILLGDTPEEFAAQVVRLLGDDELRTRVAAEGQRLVQENYGWRTVTAQFARYCDEVASRRDDRDPRGTPTR